MRAAALLQPVPCAAGTRDVRGWACSRLHVLTLRHVGVESPTACTSREHRMGRLGGLFVSLVVIVALMRGARRHGAADARSLLAAITQAGDACARRARPAGVRAALRLLSWRRCARRRAGRFRSAAVRRSCSRTRAAAGLGTFLAGRAAREEHAEVRSAAAAGRRDRRVPARARRRRIQQPASRSTSSSAIRRRAQRISTGQGGARPATR